MKISLPFSLPARSRFGEGRGEGKGGGGVNQTSIHGLINKKTKNGYPKQFSWFANHDSS
jgi:hypothetical protein